MLAPWKKIYDKPRQCTKMQRHYFSDKGPYQFSSAHFSCSVTSNSLWPREPQHTGPPCPSLTPGVHPNPCPLCWWYHPTISSSDFSLTTCPQSLPASGSFPMSQLSASGGQDIGVSASACPSIEHPVLISFRMDWLDLLAVQGTLKSLLQHHSLKESILRHSLYSSTLTSIHDYWKNHSLD